jgi:RNA polymerase sigma-70 factor (ECF subfamily)
MQHLPSLRAHARRLTKDFAAANDLLQDTALRALSFAWSFEPGSNVRAWLHQVMESLFLSACRKGARERRAHDALVRDPCSWMRNEPIAPAVALSPRVRGALSALPQGFREVLVLVDVNELAYKDAARRLGVPLGTVMSRLHRGRRLLAARLQDGETALQAA